MTVIMEGNESDYRVVIAPGNGNIDRVLGSESNGVINGLLPMAALLLN